MHVHRKARALLPGISKLYLYTFLYFGKLTLPPTPRIGQIYLADRKALASKQKTPHGGLPDNPRARSSAGRARRACAPSRASSERSGSAARTACRAHVFIQVLFINLKP